MGVAVLSRSTRMPNYMLATLEPEREIHYQIQPDQYAWLQVARGSAILNNERLQVGDGVQMNGEENLAINTETGAEILLFNLA